MSKQKAIIYARVSSRTQQEIGHGLESQEIRCRQYAEAKGLKVEAVFPDTFTGGGDFMRRPGMIALLAFIDAQPNEKFIILFDDLKRLARDRDYHFRLREAFRDRGAQIECLNYTFDETPEGEFVETIFAAQGQLERKQNGRQVAQKMRARMENGFWIHNAPVGFRYKTEKFKGKVLVFDPPWDGVVREAFEGYASGRFQTQAEVKRFLETFPDFPFNKNGQVKQQQVTRMLTQPVYTGHICSENYGINWLKAQHEPIVSLEVFDKVQERRAGFAKAPKRKNIGDAFALRGIAICACCDVPLRSSFSRGKLGKLYPYMLCQTKGCDAYGKSIKRDQIENDVGEIIKSLQPDQSVIRMMAKMFRHIWEARKDQASSILADGKRKLTSIDKEIDKLLELIMASSNTTVIQKYEERISQHEHDKARLREKLAHQAEPSGTFEEKLEPALAFLANPWKLWETSGKSQVFLRRIILKLAFTDRIRYCRNEGARTPQIAFPFKALSGLDTQLVCSGAGEGTRTPTP
ncbi:recombinase family protein [uncultured Sulfitobacter sp.]|uniref:recombinase family protein n=1 Tax=uncultured Sulfitobacter sp. TaxID=191468 RepID=UPI002628622F|nr:recombinase family protein [uncultured Sulfitobacter sp.]